MAGWSRSDPTVLTLAAFAHAAEPVSQLAERRFQAALTGGAATYAPFAFATAGAEVGVRLTGGLSATAGVGLWGTNRVLPPEAQLESGVYSEWNWMQPLHLGALYRVQAGPVEPFAAVDGLAVNYYRGQGVSAWSFGARARGGADWFFHPNLGVRAEAWGGAWGGGGSWSEIDSRAADTGPVAGAAAGLVAGF